MSENLIVQPYTTLIDPNPSGGRARPLANAKVYIGIRNFNPIDKSVRIPVYYQDEQGNELEIAQPLITNESGAFVTPQGQLIQPYTRTIGYSILIEDKNGKTIYLDKKFGSRGTTISAEANTYWSGVAAEGQTVISPTDQSGNIIPLNSIQLFINAKLETNYEIDKPSSGQITVGYKLKQGQEIDIYAKTPVNIEVSTGIVSGVYFAGVEKMKQGERYTGDVDLEFLAENGEYVNTMWYHDPENGGAAVYRLMTLASYRSEIDDQTWAPDGFRDHYLLNGTEYIALLTSEVDGVQYASQYGVKYNDSTYAAQNQLRLNAAIEYLCPFPWQGTSEATYFDKHLGEGTVVIDRGYLAVDDTIKWNPGITIEGVTNAHRTFGKKFISAGVRGSVLLGVGDYKKKYLLDTANYKDSTGTRMLDSDGYITNSSADSKLATWAEGVFLRNISVVNGGDNDTGGAFAGGVRMCLAMMGGFDGIAISGFDNNLQTSNCWNLTVGSAWLEESYLSHIGFESTNPSFTGNMVYVGNADNKFEIPQRVFDSVPKWFGNELTGDDKTLPNEHKFQSKAIFMAYCWNPTWTDAKIEFFQNPICAYGNTDSKITFENLREEGNKWEKTIKGTPDVRSTLVSGWNTIFRFNKISSLSDTPFQAVGTGSIVEVASPIIMKGDTFNGDHIDGSSRGNPFLIRNWIQSALSPKTMRTHNVQIERRRSNLDIFIDESAGDSQYMGVNSSQPTTLNAFCRGVVASWNPASSSTIYGASNGNYDAILTGAQTHTIGDAKGSTTLAGFNDAEVNFVRSGGTTTNTKITKSNQADTGPRIKNSLVSFEGLNLESNYVGSFQAENNGLFRTEGKVSLELNDVTCSRNTGSAAPVMFTAVDACNLDVTYNSGDMFGIDGTSGLVSVVTDGRCLYTGSFFNVTAKKTSPSSIGEAQGLKEVTI
tara:strand:+ start:3916 stop:6726 length:2811 start_codon:yes stop_codon:yes gene_type:complete